MMSLKCHNLARDCHFIAKGNTKDQVVKEMTGHARAAHPEVFDISKEKMAYIEKKMNEMISQE